MKSLNFAYLTGSYDSTPPELVGMYPLGEGGVIEAPYRHYFEARRFRRVVGRLSKAMNVVEFGSGNGRWAKELAPEVGHYTGVDLTPEAVAIARAMAECRGLRNVTFVEGSITDYRPDAPLDVIYFSGVSQFLTDDALGRLLAELAPFMGPATVIVDRSTLQFGERLVRDDADYFSIYRTPAELDGIFMAPGFRLVGRKPSYPILRIGSLLRWLHNHPRLRALLERWTRPGGFVAMHALLALTRLADTFRPVDPVKRGWSHDFSVYRPWG